MANLHRRMEWNQEDKELTVIIIMTMKMIIIIIIINSWDIA
jgi:hypothetical protein